jgi:hypothetical protein
MHMRFLHHTLILFAALGLALSSALPADDVSETPYDESEARPYESTPLFSIATQEPARVFGSGLILTFSAVKCAKVLVMQSAHTPHLTFRSLIILDHAFRC